MRVDSQPANTLHSNLTRLDLNRPMTHLSPITGKQAKEWAHESGSIPANDTSNWFMCSLVASLPKTRRNTLAHIAVFFKQGLVLVINYG